MKSIIHVWFLFLFLFSYSFSDTEYSQKELKNKVTGYGTMEGVGLTFLATGAVLVVTGIVYIASADWETHTTGTGIHKTTQDPKGGKGLKMLVAGIPFTACGTVLGIIGAKKRREYKRRLQWSGIRLKYTPYYNSYELVFNF